MQNTIFNGPIFRINSCLVVFGIILAAPDAWGQLDSVHYIPPAHSRSTSDVEQYLYLSTPETTPFPITVSYMRLIGFNFVYADSTVWVSNTAPVELVIGYIDYSSFLVATYELNKPLTGRGIIARGPKNFYANLRVRQGDQAGSLTAKGVSGTGYIFRIAHLINSNGASLSNFVGLMATEDNTVITLSGYTPGIALQNGSTATNAVYYPGIAINITLNAGQSYVLSAYCRNNYPTNANGLIGTLVSSSKPIAVNCGSWWANHPSAGQDIGIDQIAPLERTGTEHVLVRGAASFSNSSNNLETPIVVAHYDNTQVFINGSTTPNFTINAGEFVVIPPSFYTNSQNMYIKTSRPVFMYQSLAGGTDTNNAGLNFIPPLSCLIGPSVDNIPWISYIGGTLFNGSIFIIAQAGCDPAVSTTGTNGVLTGPYPVPGNPDYVTYEGTGYTGHLKVVSDCPIQVGILGRSGARGWGGYFSGFDQVIEPDVEIFSNAFCPDTLFLKKKYINGGVVWSKDGQTFTPSNDSVLVSLSSGTYTVIGRYLTSCGDELADTSAFTVPDSYPKFEVNITPPPCHATSGQATLAPLQSGTNYSYSWSTGQTGPTQTLPAGQYTATVTNNSTGCRTIRTVEITDPPPPQLNAPQSVSKCPEHNATLSASGNFVSYAWSNNQQGETVSVTQPGSYTVTATDANGCTVVGTVQVTNHPAPDADITGDDKICPGVLSTLSAPSGLGYAWSGNAGSTQSVSVPPGAYFLTVTNGYGCTNTGSFNVAQLAPPVATLTSDKEKICKPETAFLTVTTNAPVVSYDWNIPGASGTQYVITDSSTVTVVVTDSEGCRDTVMLSIPAYDYVVPDITTDSLSICPGQETTVLSAERPDVVSYQWLPTQQTTPEITVGIAGQYTVEVVFTNGCTATNSVQITNDSIPNAAITGDDKICPGALSTLSAPSGLGYIWSGNAGSTQSVSVPPGAYTLTVTNGYGCTNTGSFSVIQLAPPVATLTSDKEKICKPETALLMVTTDVPVVSYDWNISGASGTQYVIADSSTVTVVVTDSEGCRDTVTLSIPAYNYEEPKITGKLGICPGQETTVLRADNQNVVDYHWLPTLQTTPDITVGTAGLYTVEVEYANGCTATNSVQVVEHSLPQPFIQGPPSICDKSTGIFSAGGSYSAYSWSNGASTANIEAPAGTYSVTVTDANLCTGVAEFSSALIPLIHAQLSAPDEVCQGEPVVAATALQATSLNGIVWLSNSGGAKYGATVAQGIVAPWTTYLTASGTIRVDSISLTGYPCVFEGVPAEITVQVDDISAAAVPEQAANGYSMPCAYPDGSGSISATVQGGQSPYSYTWSTGNTGTGSIGNLNAGTYTLTVTGANGCTTVSETAIVEPPALVVEVRAHAPKCKGVHDGKIAFRYLSGQGNYQVSINGGNLLSSPDSISHLPPGVYNIQVEDEYCQWDTSIVFAEPPVRFVELGDSLNVHLELGDHYQFKTVTNAQAASIQWGPPYFLNDTLSLRPIANPVTTTWYSLVVTTPEGCVLKDQLLIRVKNTHEIYVPNAIYLDRENENSILSVSARPGAVKRLRMQIFDRWGSKVYENPDQTPNDPGSGWDGRVNGEYVNPAVYAWVLEVEYTDGVKEVLKGDVTLIR